MSWMRLKCISPLPALGVDDVHDAYAEIRGHGRVVSFVPLSVHFTPFL